MDKTEAGIQLLRIRLFQGFGERVYGCLGWSIGGSKHDCLVTKYGNIWRYNYIYGVNPSLFYSKLSPERI